VSHETNGVVLSDHFDSDNWWLRQAVFYFDEVGSIVPQTMTWGGESLGELIPFTSDLEFLKQEGIFRAISPEQFTMGRGWDEAWKLQEDLKAIVTTERHRAQRSDEYVHVHRGKTSDSTLNTLHSGRADQTGGIDALQGRSR
jgi:hypothetical protein